MSSSPVEINFSPQIVPPPLAPALPGTVYPIAPQSAMALCPICSQPLEDRIGARAFCMACGWKGQAYVFTPLPIVVEHAEHALPEDATCMHHPTKKATAVCSGTGDYICSLCAIELNGRTYSAEYLNNKGKDEVGKAFDPYLARPDSQIIMCLYCCFIPYLNVVFVPTAFVWIPWSVFLYVKALRMRRTNPIFARAMGMGRVIGIPIWLGIFAAGWIIGVAAIAVHLSSD
jgi:hypothetical protein